MPQKCNLKRKISLWLHNYVSIKNYIEWFCSKASTLMKCLTYPDLIFAIRSFTGMFQTFWP